MYEALPTDTIAAIATAPGQAALGIIRISGPAACDLLQQVVQTSRHCLSPDTMAFGRVFDRTSGALVDEVMCFFRRGPRTATGEDVAEIHAHGGPLVLRDILARVCAAGARAALPGEFTSRAFFNGRMDLTRAEAVMALIGAKSEQAARVAARQLEGAIGKGLEDTYDALTDIRGQLEAGLDHPDEDLVGPSLETIALSLDNIRSTLERACQSFRRGTLLTRGARIVIAGPSNAGKSSLFNRLAGADRAIVDAEPGTTRDVVEAIGERNGIPLTFCDTAGLRGDAPRVEQQGIERAKQAAAAADILLLVMDGTAGTPPEDVLELARLFADRSILIANKCDLPAFSPPDMSPLPSPLCISARSGDGLVPLMGRIDALLQSDIMGDVVLTTGRQHDAVDDACRHTAAALALLLEKRDPELVALELRRAQEAFASLWGRHASTDVIDRIFSTFCLGK